MIASWSGSRVGPTEYKVAARFFARYGGLPSGRLLTQPQHPSQAAVVTSSSHLAGWAIPFRYVTEKCMPRGRQPDGEHALSNAERQARYRARRQAEQPPAKVRYRSPPDRRTRARRWHDAVARLVALQTEYTAWYDALPDSLRDSATAEALQAIVELDLDALTDIVPPRGYGRD